LGRRGAAWGWQSLRLGAARVDSWGLHDHGNPSANSADSFPC
jgi:hypothetical protein